MWCCTRTDIVREHLEDTLRICDVSAMGLYIIQQNRHNIFCPKSVKPSSTKFIINSNSCCFVSHCAFFSRKHIHNVVVLGLGI